MIFLKSPPQEGRIHWVEMVRGIGMFCIVFGHAIRGVGLAGKMVFAFHVPLFFFLSGYLFRDGASLWKDVICKRGKKLLVPYIVFGMLSILIYQLLGRLAADILGKDFYTFRESIAWLLYGFCKANAPLWFLPCLFLTNIILWICVKLYRSICSRGNGIRIICIVAPMILSTLFAGFYFRAFSFRWPWSLNTALCLFVFTWAGYALKEVNLSFFKKRWMIVPATVILAMGLFLALFVNDQVTYTDPYYGQLSVFYPAAAGIILGICWICLILDRCQVLEWIGQNTMPILLMHKFPLLFFQCVCPGVKSWLVSQPLIWGILVSILSIVMCRIADDVLRNLIPSAWNAFAKRS